MTKAGQQREYESALLRRTYRQGGKVRNQTVANLSALPADVLDLVEAALKGTEFVPADQACTVTRSAQHGHVAAVMAMARKLGFPALLGPPCRERDLALAAIISRVAHPASKRSTRNWWANTTLGEDLAVAEASTDEIYAAMDWLADRQPAIERTLAAKHLTAENNPSPMALFDLTSAWMEGQCCPLASHGYSRDGKRGRTQIEYGILTDPAGCPVAVRVFDGATADPAAFTEILQALRNQFELTELVLVGDRGMITKARVEDIQRGNDDPDTDDAFGWITALRAPSIAKLVRDGPLQLSLFDECDLAEITHPDYPGERLIACRNPLQAAQRAHKREDLLAATETQLAELAARVATGTLAGVDAIGVAVGKVINKHKVGKHFTYHITDDGFTYHRDQERIDAEAALDGIYVIRTNLDTDTLDAAGVVTGYKNLSHVERDFRSIKVDDLDLRPIRHYLEDRVRAHVLICMLACYVTWHLRRAWAELTFTDEHPPSRENPVAPARRSAEAKHKDATGHDEHGRPVRSFHDLLDHLATLTRNQVRYHGTNAEIAQLTEATDEQRRAFDLIDSPIPLTIG